MTGERSTGSRRQGESSSSRNNMAGDVKLTMIVVVVVVRSNIGLYYIITVYSLLSVACV